MTTMIVHIYGDQPAMEGGIQLSFANTYGGGATSVTPHQLSIFQSWYHRNLHDGLNLRKIWQHTLESQEIIIDEGSL